MPPGLYSNEIAVFLHADHVAHCEWKPEAFPIMKTSELYSVSDAPLQGSCSTPACTYPLHVNVACHMQGAQQRF